MNTQGGEDVYKSANPDKFERKNGLIDPSGQNFDKNM
jgi:hypothetical protein